MRIYTKTGDQGETGLVGGQRIGKDALRVEAIGSVDELNSHLGAARVEIADAELDALLERIQNELFDLGAQLATPPDAPDAKTYFTEANICWLEEAIDRFDEELPPLNQFLLPGGTKAAAQAHLARAVCRRAERRVVTLLNLEGGCEDLVRYLNRLSDFLFMLARLLNFRAHHPDTLWGAPGFRKQPKSPADLNAIEAQNADDNTLRR